MPLPRPHSWRILGPWGLSQLSCWNRLLRRLILLSWNLLLAVSGGLLRSLLLGHDFREVKDRQHWRFCSLRASAALSCGAGVSCAGVSDFSGAGASGTGCLLLSLRQAGTPPLSGNLIFACLPLSLNTPYRSPTVSYCGQQLPGNAPIITCCRLTYL